MAEGTALKFIHYKRTDKSFNRTKREGRALDFDRVVAGGREDPKTSFMELFSKYQVTEYRGVPLWGFWDGLSFFSHHRESGLGVNPVREGYGSIDDTYSSWVSSALRGSSRRDNPEFLRDEARVILGVVLPGNKSSYNSSPFHLAIHRLVTAELREAFSNLGLL